MNASGPRWTVTEGAGGPVGGIVRAAVQRLLLAEWRKMSSVVWASFSVDACASLLRDSGSIRYSWPCSRTLPKNTGGSDCRYMAEVHGNRTHLPVLQPAHRI